MSPSMWVTPTTDLPTPCRPAPQVLRALHDSGKPLVGHNCLFDLLVSGAAYRLPVLLICVLLLSGSRTASKRYGAASRNGFSIGSPIFFSHLLGVRTSVPLLYCCLYCLQFVLASFVTGPQDLPLRWSGFQELIQSWFPGEDDGGAQLGTPEGKCILLKGRGEGQVRYPKYTMP